MKCPVCGFGSDVKDSRPNRDDDVIRRRRACMNGHSFTTWEVPAVEGGFMIVNQPDGRQRLKRFSFMHLRDKVLEALSLVTGASASIPPTPPTTPQT